MVTQTDVCSSAMKIIQRCKVLGHSCSPKACNLENCHGMKVRLCTWFCWLTGRWVDPVKASLDMMLNLELPPMHGSVWMLWMCVWLGEASQLKWSCLTDHKYICYSYCTRKIFKHFSDLFSIIWNKLSNSGSKDRRRPCQSSRLWRLFSVWLEQRSATTVWSSHVCILRYFIFQDTASFSQCLANKFKQPWLWWTSLSGHHWSELMSWTPSSTVNRSMWLYGVCSSLCKNHPAADTLNISTTSDCSTHTTYEWVPNIRKYFHLSIASYSYS